MLLDAEIRYLDTSLLQLGEREDEDNVIEYVARVLTDREQLESTLAAVANMSDLAVRLQEKAQADASVRTVVGTYFLARAYASKGVNNTEDEQRFLDAATLFIPGAVALTPKDIYEKFSSLKKRHKELRTLLAERSAFKIEVRASDIIAVLTIVPAVMFVAGLWYVSNLLAEFGLQASLYYTIGDYVASSLNQLSLAAISVAWSLGTILMGMRHGSLRSRMANEALRKRDKLPLVIVLFAVVLTVTIIIKSLDGEFDRYAFTMLGITVSYPLAEKFAEAFSKNVLQVQMATTALLVFATLTYSASISEINNIKHNRWGEKINTKILMKPNSPISTNNLIVIAANSNYVFALDKVTKIAYAISRDQIAAMSVGAN